MEHNPYEQFSENEMILRDYLALDRTILANERTFLAYLRTGLALGITGAGCIKLFDSFMLDISGFVLIVFGVCAMIFGFQRYRSMNRRIKASFEGKDR